MARIHAGENLSERRPLWFRMLVRFALLVGLFTILQWIIKEVQKMTIHVTEIQFLIAAVAFVAGFAAGAFAATHEVKRVDRKY